MNADAWLEANTFYCDRLHARISPAQCAANRARPESGDLLGEKPTRPTACADCPGHAATKKEKTMPKLRGLCELCLRPEMTISAGLCGPCRGLTKTGAAKRRPDDGWELKDEALDKINELRLIDGLPEISLSEPWTAEAQNKPACPCKAGTPKLQPTAAPDTDDAVMVDGELLPLIPLAMSRPLPKPYLRVSPARTDLDIPDVTLRALPGASAVRLFGRPGAKSLAIQAADPSQPEARKLCVKSNSLGRKVYCERLIRELNLQPGVYPVEFGPEGRIHVRLDRKAA